MMRKMITFVSAIAFAAVSVPAVTWADGQDCHALKRWLSSNKYPKGTHIWSNERGSAEHGSEFVCNKTECSGSDKPGGPAWDLIGSCKTGTAPPGSQS